MLRPRSVVNKGVKVRTLLCPLGSGIPFFKINVFVEFDPKAQWSHLRSYWILTRLTSGCHQSLLHDLCWTPARLFTKKAIEVAIACWEWLLTTRTDIEEKVCSEYKLLGTLLLTPFPCCCFFFFLRFWSSRGFMYSFLAWENLLSRNL